ncbi:hypothetical protein [Methanolobus sp.]|uniref:hypothetical protein n=1 Tax=Methanolobus sp. TaxID=1874737 RepID=UPI0025CF9F25|nr:hypothetical protein [Methanolobus sp.]
MGEKMSFNSWANSILKKTTWVDMALIKISAAAFALMVAKLWEPLLRLDWYWYAFIFVLAAIKPAYKALK